MTNRHTVIYAAQQTVVLWYSTRWLVKIWQPAKSTTFNISRCHMYIFMGNEEASVNKYGSRIIQMNGLQGAVSLVFWNLNFVSLSILCTKRVGVILLDVFLFLSFCFSLFLTLFFLNGHLSSVSPRLVYFVQVNC